MVVPKLNELNKQAGDYFIDGRDYDPKNKFKPEQILSKAEDYPRWYRKMKAFLAEKEKLEFVEGKHVNPPSDHKNKNSGVIESASKILGALVNKAYPYQQELEAWYNCNDLIVEWIKISVSPRIIKDFSDKVKDSASGMWKSLKQKYSPGDHAIISNFIREIHACKQGNNESPKDFQEKIETYYKELDALRPLPKYICSDHSNCSYNSIRKQLKKQRHEEMMGVFLTGLKAKHREAVSRILKMKSLPSFEIAVAIIG